jgi:flagella basal body P-ring formation protein FlgA
MVARGTHGVDADREVTVRNESLDRGLLVGTTRALAWIVAVLCAAGCTGTAMGAEAAARANVADSSRIVLRAFARVEPGHAVMLGDIANLEGTLAQSLAGVVVLDAGQIEAEIAQGGTAKATGAGLLRTSEGREGDGRVGASTGPRVDVTVARVREVLDAHDRTLAGRVLLSGSTSRVTVAAARATDAAVAMSAASAGAGAAASATDAVAAAGTVGAVVGAAIADALGVPRDAVRAEFGDADAAFLATPAGAGRTVAATPTGVGARMGVMVRVFEGDRIVASRSVRAEVRVRRVCAVATTTLERSTVVEAAQVRREERWVVPGLGPASPDEAVGRVTRVRVEAGGVIESRHLEVATVVARGDVVTVECVSGTVVLRSVARAREAGRVGDVIMVEPLRGGEARRYRARVAGPGRAVVVTGERGPAWIAPEGVGDAGGADAGGAGAGGADEGDVMEIEPVAGRGLGTPLAEERAADAVIAMP